MTILKKQHFFIFVSSLIISFNCKAQNLYLTGVFSNYVQSGRLTNKLNYTINLLSVYNTSQRQYGDKVFPSGHCHFVPHLLLNRKLAPQLNVAAGYAYGRHDIFGLRESEHRYIGQGSYTQKMKLVGINHRVRYEYRRPKNLKTQVVSDASIIRYQLGLNYPLYNPQKKKSGFYLQASNEFFFYLKGATNGPVSSRNGKLLSEDWANIGLGYNFGRNRLEMGYGYQQLVRNKDQNLRCFHLLQMSYMATINWDDVQFWWY